MNKLKAMKRNEGVDDTDDTTPKRKVFKKKQPNPLSCKKKKKTKRAGDSENSKGVSDKAIEKKQRSRSRKKLPKHVKEHLQTLNKN